MKQLWTKYLWLLVMVIYLLLFFIMKKLYWKQIGNLATIFKQQINKAPKKYSSTYNLQTRVGLQLDMAKLVRIF